MALVPRLVSRWVHGNIAVERISHRYGVIEAMEVRPDGPVRTLQWCKEDDWRVELPRVLGEGGTPLVHHPHHPLPVVILDAHLSCLLSPDHGEDFLMHADFCILDPLLPAGRFLIATCFVVLESLKLVLGSNVGDHPWAQDILELLKS